MKNQLIQDIKNFRVSIDGLMQLVKAEIKSAEMQVCYNKLKYAKAWSGIGLQQLGNPTPYQNDGSRKDVKDIEETADSILNKLLGSSSITHGNDTISVHWQTYNTVEKIDYLREEIKRTLTKFGNIEVLHLKYVQEEKLKNFYDSQIQKIHFKTFHLIEQYLHEARFELGFELQRLKENDEKRGIEHNERIETVENYVKEQGSGTIPTTEGNDKISDEVIH